MEAKVLYGLMLDRMGLSVRNGWLDSENRVYIYFTLEDALEMLGCGKDKAVRLFKELDKSGGIGLIERRKQGQGKPARIYVKNFTLPPEPEECTPVPAPGGPQVQTSEKPKSALLAASAVLTSEIPKSALLESRSPDCGKSAANKTDRNKTELSDSELSIHPPTPTPSPGHRRMGVRTRMDRMDAYRALIHENISYGDLIRDHPYDADLIDGYVDLIVEVCCTGTLRGIYVAFNTIFNQALTEVQPMYTEIASVIPSTTDSETYAWLGDIPGMREWIGDREG